MYMPPPSGLEKKAICSPWGENDGLRSSAGFCVSRLGCDPPVSGCTHKSRLVPLDARSDAYATSFPSGDKAGVVVSPLSAVNGLSRHSPDAGAGRSRHHSATPATPSSAAAMTAANTHPGDLRCA